MVDAAEFWSGKAEGVYFTLNPVQPDLLALAANRAKPYAEHSTTDKDILCRRFLLLDFDPKRRSGISATDAEHQAALNRAIECRQCLRDLGWPDPLFNNSGNGAHLIYRIDLKNDKAANALVKAVLNALAAKWDDDAVTVDKSVHNAARIVKLPGTLAAKGDHIEDRPHRIARIIDLPEHKAIVTREQLDAIAGETSRHWSKSTAIPALSLSASTLKHGFASTTSRSIGGVESRRIVPLTDAKWQVEILVWRDIQGGVRSSNRLDKHNSGTLQESSAVQQLYFAQHRSRCWHELEVGFHQLAVSSVGESSTNFGVAEPQSLVGHAVSAALFGS